VARIAFTPHPTGYGIYSIARLGHYEDEVAEPEEYTKRQAPGEDRLAELSHWGKSYRAAGVLFAVLAQDLAGGRVWAGSIRALRTFP
jgi:hypothetical protein